MQDDIIRRKLLADGEVSGDDRRITLAHKTFLQWTKRVDAGESGTSELEKMETMLDQCVWNMLKGLKVYEMNVKQVQYYADLHQTVAQQIEDANEKINECKKELEEAKQIRKHRQEYELMACQIQKHPPRADTLQKLDEGARERQELERRQDELENKLQLRKNQFHALLTCLHDLKSILKDEMEIGDDNEDHGESSPAEKKTKK